MNNQFKKEFQNLDVEQIKYILNRCAGQDILQDDISHGGRSCFIKYIPFSEGTNYIITLSPPQYSSNISNKFCFLLFRLFI